MEKYARIPLLFFSIAAWLGVFLRWQFIVPTPEIQYTNFLHAHSHTMFLGWIFNAFYIAFTIHFIPKDNRRIFQALFIIAQALVVLMLISFPLQGYGFYSILFSTLHTLLAFVFIFLFFKRTRNLQSVPAWFAKVSLIFFVLSSIGPFSLGYLMSQGLGQTQWYYFSIYYYLHFQYNGFFIFAAFSLLFQLFELKQIEYGKQTAKQIGLWLAAACVPAYFLSVLWASPPTWVYIVAALAGAIQLVAVGLLFWVFKNISIKKRFTKPSQILLGIASICFALKIILQVASSIPAAASFAYEYRPIIIAYLHLILIGVISITIIIWYLEMKIIQSSRVLIPLVLFVSGFVGSELGLLFQPWWNLILPASKYFDSTTFNLYCALFLGLATIWFLAVAVRKSDKDHIAH